MTESKDVRLIISPETREILEKRRLTDDEIRTTLVEAETTGKKFIHPQTGHLLAGARQGNVTVWVKYEPGEEGYVIHTAYQYRVKISAWDLATGTVR